MQAGLFSLLPQVVDAVTVPVVAAGGIADGHTFLGALALGADGIYMGTAFEVTQECRLSAKIKQNIVDAPPDHPGLIHELLAPPDPEAYMQVRAAKDSMPAEASLPTPMGGTPTRGRATLTGGGEYKPTFVES